MSLTAEYSTHCQSAECFGTLATPQAGVKTDHLRRYRAEGGLFLLFSEERGNWFFKERNKGSDYGLQLDENGCLEYSF